MDVLLPVLGVLFYVVALLWTLARPLLFSHLAPPLSSIPDRYRTMATYDLASMRVPPGSWRHPWRRLKYLARRLKGLARRLKGLGARLTLRGLWGQVRWSLKTTRGRRLAFLLLVLPLGFGISWFIYLLANQDPSVADFVTVWGFVSGGIQYLLFGVLL